MELASLLQPTAVRHISDISSKKRLLQVLAESAGEQLEVPAATINAALLERESLGPTGVGRGVALPHARLPGIEGVWGMFVRLETPVDFEAVDRQPVDLVFALFAPEDAGTEHLKALALVSRTLRDRELCEKLRANSDPSALYTLLTTARQNQAA